MLKALSVLSVALFLSACGGTAAQKISELYDKGTDLSAKGMAEVLEVQCLRDPGRRQNMVNKINDQQAVSGKVARAVAQDCDGDGQPDF